VVQTSEEEDKNLEMKMKRRKKIRLHIRRFWKLLYPDCHEDI